MTSGSSYVVPGKGTITSWSHWATSGSNQMLIMKVFRKVTDPSFYKVVGHDGPHPLTQAVLNTRLVNIPVEAGDVLGLNGTDSANVACGFDAPGDSYLFRVGNLADGDAEAFTPVAAGRRLNISAVFSPSNSFTFGKIRRNQRKGTATIAVDVPNPGELTGSGKGVKVASAAVISRRVTAPGKVKLRIRARGSKKRRLERTGRVSVRLKVTYTPTGGDHRTRSKKLRLKKR